LRAFLYDGLATCFVRRTGFRAGEPIPASRQFRRRAFPCGSKPERSGDRRCTTLRPLLAGVLAVEDRVGYGRWLTERATAAAALRELRARDHAARDFKRYLKLEQSWKPASVKLALAAVDHFNRFLGLGPAIVSREPLAQSAPRALSGDERGASTDFTPDNCELP